FCRETKNAFSHVSSGTGPQKTRPELQIGLQLAVVFEVRTCCSSGGNDLLDTRRHDASYVGMLQIADVFRPHARREIARSDDEAVNVLHAQDLRQTANAPDVFDHDGDKDLVIGVAEVVAHAKALP